MTDRLVLVVADHPDVGARTAARAASSSLGDPARILVVSGAELAAARWRHRLTSYGQASTVLRIPGRPELTDENLAAVLYRSDDPLVPPGLRHAAGRDRGYAGSELTALVTSWLLSLGPRVMNAVEGASPCGAAWGQDRWLRLAADAGFPVAAGMAQRSLLVAGREVVDAAGERERRLALRLAELTGCRLLEVSVSSGGDVTAVTCTPPLLRPTHVAALAHTLVDLARRPEGVAA